MAAVKTAISVPSHLFEEMDKVSKRLRISRSRLFAIAVEEFLEHRRAEELTARVNRAYAKSDSTRDRRLRQAAAGAFRRLLEKSP